MFNVRGIVGECTSFEAIERAATGGGHQYFLLLDRKAGTIYGINHTSHQDENDFLFFKDQVERFLHLIGDQARYGFELLNGKSHQPENEAYVVEMGGVSQFLDYAALDNGVAVHALNDVIPPRLSTLLYVLQFAVEKQDANLLEMLEALSSTLNEAT